jgi:hypothetical protein
MIRTYTVLGIEHILSGSIIFVLGLVLLVQDAAVAHPITAFTVAHC